jgi:hypothetical protein
MSEYTYLSKEYDLNKERRVQDEMIEQIKRINKLSGSDFICLLDEVCLNGSEEIAIEILRTRGLI